MKNPYETNLKFSDLNVGDFFRLYKSAPSLLAKTSNYSWCDADKFEKIMLLPWIERIHKTFPTYDRMVYK